MESQIVIDPNVCNGRPIVQGTRITAQTVLDFLAAGDSVEGVIEAYPRLTREDVQACIRYAAQLMGNHFTFTAVA
jgi:uncharacterized protein (DUF433 family)